MNTNSDINTIANGVSFIIFPTLTVGWMYDENVSNKRLFEGCIIINSDEN
jgi:hypothetical protein